VTAAPLDPPTLIAALRRTAGDVSRAARLLGVSRPMVRYRVERWGLDTAAIRDFEPVVMRETPPAVPRLRLSKRPLVRVGSDCAAARLLPQGTGNGSRCAGPAVLGEVEVTERTIRNVAVEMPIVSVNAYKEHWGQRIRRRRKIHRVIREALGVPGWTPPELPAGWRWRVTFTRYSKLRLDDDNMTSACKSHRDAVSDCLGLDDRDKRVSFRCVQARWSEKALVKRWDRVAKQHVLKPGYRCFFRVRIEQVKGQGT
jgi:Bacterial regulatory protein, Fis family